MLKEQKWYVSEPSDSESDTAGSHTDDGTIALVDNTTIPNDDQAKLLAFLSSNPSIIARRSTPLARVDCDGRAILALSLEIDFQREVARQSSAPAMQKPNGKPRAGWVST